MNSIELLQSSPKVIIRKWDPIFILSQKNLVTSRLWCLVIAALKLQNLSHRKGWKKLFAPGRFTALNFFWIGCSHTCTVGVSGDERLAFSVSFVYCHSEPIWKINFEEKFIGNWNLCLVFVFAESLDSSAFERNITIKLKKHYNKARNYH